MERKEMKYKNLLEAVIALESIKRRPPKTKEEIDAKAEKLYPMEERRKDIEEINKTIFLAFRTK